MGESIIQQRNKKAYKGVSMMEPTECSKLSTSVNSPSTNANISLKKLKKQVAEIFFLKFPKNSFQSVDKGKIIVYNKFTQDMNSVNTTQRIQYISAVSRQRSVRSYKIKYERKEWRYHSHSWNVTEG